MLRILHTADWHLGQTLHGLAREYEHQCFLDWLLEILERERIDALIIAGDVFDSGNPSASAQALFFRFLARARRSLPRLEIVVIAGNHDSPARLDAPGPLLGEIGVHVVGTLPRQADGSLDFDRLLVPIHDGQGRLAALCAAVPFLRPADLPTLTDEDDPLVEGVRAVYREIVERACLQLDRAQALIVTGHCYMVGAALSELSERKILGGNQHALPVDIFPSGVAYAALGHLHLPQVVGDVEHVRYCGSPIPLAVDESAYPHQVLRVTISGSRCSHVRPILTPRFVPVLRVGEPAESIEEVIEAIDDLSLEPRPRERQPFLEVRLALDKPVPDLRTHLEKALSGLPVRLIRIAIQYPEMGSNLADSLADVPLDEMAPEDVFIRRHLQLRDQEPPAELLAAFHELLGHVQREGRV